MKFAHFEFDLKEDLIGSGQSSHVYRAKDLSLDRLLAVQSNFSLRYEMIYILP